jgi:hypothetical protein
MNLFKIQPLQQNLLFGRGSSISFPTVSSIKVSLGQGTLRGPLNSFYVNELPRIHTSNKHIHFKTIEAEKCALEVTINGRVVDVGLEGIASAKDIYKRLTLQIK